MASALSAMSDEVQVTQPTSMNTTLFHNLAADNAPSTSVPPNEDEEEKERKRRKDDDEWCGCFDSTDLCDCLYFCFRSKSNSHSHATTEASNNDNDNCDCDCCDCDSC